MSQENLIESVNAFHPSGATALVAEPDILSEGGCMSGIVRELAELPPASIVNLEALARIFGVHVATIHRAVRRGELPEPIRMFGRKCWTAGVILEHIESRLTDAGNEAQSEATRIARLSLGY